MNVFITWDELSNALGDVRFQLSRLAPDAPERAVLEEREAALTRTKDRMTREQHDRDLRRAARRPMLRKAFEERRILIVETIEKIASCACCQRQNYGEQPVRLWELHIPSGQSDTMLMLCEEHLVNLAGTAYAAMATEGERRPSRLDRLADKFRRWSRRMEASGYHFGLLQAFYAGNRVKLDEPELVEALARYEEAEAMRKVTIGIDETLGAAGDLAAVVRRLLA